MTDATANSPTPAQPSLSVVVPVCDEAGNIDSLLAEIHSALAGEAFEIIYVDDGSRDGTAEKLAAARRRYRALRVLTHRARAGQSAALWTAIAAARAPVIVTLDGDGQNDPADIPSLTVFRASDAPGDLRMVAGIRVARRDSLVKRWSSRVANAVRERLLGDATPDSNCGLKLFARAHYLALPRFDHMHRFLPALIQRDGGRVVLCPIAHRPRRAGRSKYGIADRLWVGIVDLFGVMWLIRRGRRPDLIDRD